MRPRCNRHDPLAARWSEISALLDQALALPATERAAWLDALEGGPAEFKDTLRTLLESHARVFLDTLPRLALKADAGSASGDSIGPYRLIRELGRGDMGTVWLAERAEGAFARVALKLPLTAR